MKAFAAALVAIVLALFSAALIAFGAIAGALLVVGICYRKDWTL